MSLVCVGILPFSRACWFLCVLVCFRFFSKFLLPACCCCSCVCCCCCCLFLLFVSRASPKAFPSSGLFLSFLSRGFFSSSSISAFSAVPPVVCFAIRSCLSPSGPFLNTNTHTRRHKRTDVHHLLHSAHTRTYTLLNVTHKYKHTQVDTSGKG